MDLGLFEKSPHVASLLVRLYDSHRLYGLARDKSPENRLELSGVMANLLEHQLTDRETELVADVLIALVRQAEMELRQSLAEKLATMDKVPLRLILHLVNDEIGVAGPILTNSPVLSDLDLVYIIKSQGAPYWQAIAKRETLSVSLIDMLAGTKEPGTALALTNNDRIRLTPYAMDILASLATEKDELARPLLMREEMPPSLARRLYAHVGQDLRNYIAAFYGRAPGDIIQAAESVVQEFAEQKRPASPPAQEADFMPTDELLASVRQMNDLGQFNATVMMETLKKGHVRNFIAMFSVLTGLMPSRALGVLQQASGQKLAIICRAYDMQKGDFTTIYLLTHRIRSTDRLVNHRDLLSALTYFDRIRPESARHLLTHKGRERVV